MVNDLECLIFEYFIGICRNHKSCQCCTSVSRSWIEVTWEIREKLSFTITLQSITQVSLIWWLLFACLALKARLARALVRSSDMYIWVPSASTSSSSSFSLVWPSLCWFPGFNILRTAMTRFLERLVTNLTSRARGARGSHQQPGVWPFRRDERWRSHPSLVEVAASSFGCKAVGPSDLLCQGCPLIVRRFGQSPCGHAVQGRQHGSVVGRYPDSVFVSQGPCCHTPSLRHPPSGSASLSNQPSYQLWGQDEP